MRGRWNGNVGSFGVFYRQSKKNKKHLYSRGAAGSIPAKIGS